MKGLARSLAVMDNNGDKRLTKEELKYGLQNYGLDLNTRELDDLFTIFGTYDISTYCCDSVSQYS
jgi:Ca2+-binding EF-hand superfamily protein